ARHLLPVSRRAPPRRARPRGAVLGAALRRRHELSAALAPGRRAPARRGLASPPRNLRARPQSSRRALRRPITARQVPTLTPLAEFHHRRHWVFAYLRLARP